MNILKILEKISVVISIINLLKKKDSVSTFGGGNGANGPDPK